MRTPHSIAVAVALTCASAVLTGCGGGEDRAAQPDDEPTGRDPASTALPQGDQPVELDPADFTDRVTNPWFPLDPGTRWTYRETTEDGEVMKVVVTATPVTHQVANGVTARVVRDTVTQGGEIVEDTRDWYAQDASGTVWYLGEDTAEFENGKLATREGSFEAGVDGAQAGVIMPAVLEHKYYARGIGLVLTIDKEAGGREELLSVTTVTRAAAGRAGRVPLGQPY